MTDEAREEVTAKLRDCYVIAPVNPLPSVHLLAQFSLLRQVLESVISARNDTAFDGVTLNFLSFGDFVLGVPLFDEAIRAHFERLMPPTNGDLGTNVVTLKAAEIGSVAQIVLRGLRTEQGTPLCPPRLLTKSRFALLRDYLASLLVRGSAFGGQVIEDGAKSFLDASNKLVARLRSTKGHTADEPLLSGNLADIFARQQEAGPTLLGAILAVVAWHAIADDAEVHWLGDNWMKELLEVALDLDGLSDLEEKIARAALRGIETRKRDFSPEGVRFFLTPFSHFCHPSSAVELGEKDAEQLTEILEELNCDLFEDEDVATYATMIGSRTKWKERDAYKKLKTQMPEILSQTITRGFTKIETTLVEQIRFIL